MSIEAVHQEAQSQVVQMLRATLSERQLRRGNYSLRSFALSLRLTPAELSEVFSGKRKVTRKMAKKVFNALSVEPALEQQLLRGLPEKQVRSKRGAFSPEASMAPGSLAASKKSQRTTSAGKGPLRSFIQLSTDEFRVVADWYYLAILSLAETESFRGDAGWIAKRLSITK
jgi:hypothetical protein